MPANQQPLGGWPEFKGELGPDEVVVKIRYSWRGGKPHIRFVKINAETVTLASLLFEVHQATRCQEPEVFCLLYRSSPFKDRLESDEQVREFARQHRQAGTHLILGLHPSLTWEEVIARLNPSSAKQSPEEQ